VNTEQRWLLALLLADAALVGVFGAWAVEHTPWCWVVVFGLVVAAVLAMRAARGE
jgi:predicted Co/Zn/Cd cation transporter (cation efflux family)